MAGIICRLSINDKVALIRSFAHEITTEPELEALLTNKPNPIAYDGFEPSGRMHIAQVSVDNL
jgi:tyrosyl-tRNA synthetase